MNETVVTITAVGGGGGTGLPLWEVVFFSGMALYVVGIVVAVGALIWRSWELLR